MDINYIILAHKGARQVARLIEKLVAKDVNIYLHIDKDTDITPFEHETAHLKNIVYLKGEQRSSAVWADFSLVKATIDCMHAIVSDGRCGYCVLLSGQDYPISDPVTRSNFFQQHYGINFIEGNPIDESIKPDEGLRRIDRYKINLSKEKNDILIFPSIYDRDFYGKQNLDSFVALAKRKTLGSCLDLISATSRKRKFPSYLKPYIGSQWWALPIETIKLIINFLEDHPDYLDYHTYTFAPDEIFFQSIVFSTINCDLIRREVTYVNWVQDIPVPMVFKEKDFGNIIEQRGHKLFARKFDGEIDCKIMDLIDNELL